MGLSLAEAEQAGHRVRAVDYDLANVSGASLYGDGYRGRARMVVAQKVIAFHSSLVTARHQVTDAEEKLSAVASKVSGVAGDVGAKAGQHWDKLESIFEARVAKALQGLGVPTKADIDALIKRIDALAKATGAEPAKKPAAKKAAAAKKAPAAKPAAAPAKKAAAKPAVKKAAPKKKGK